jgi:hypothetical protein
MEKFGGCDNTLSSREMQGGGLKHSKLFYKEKIKN